MRGVRWLGPTARIVSFSSEKAAHGYRNTLLLTDIRNRSSLAFREVGVEGAPMLGIRASPLGRYILILLRGAPSEIWAVGGTPTLYLSALSLSPLPLLFSSPLPPLLSPLSPAVLTPHTPPHPCCFLPPLNIERPAKAHNVFAVFACSLCIPFPSPPGVDVVLTGQDEAHQISTCSLFT